MYELKSPMRNRLVSSWLLPVLLVVNMVCLNADNFTISFLPAMKGGEGKKYAGAFDYAIDQANNGKMTDGDEVLLKGHRLLYKWNDTEAKTMIALKRMCEHHYDLGSIAFIGPEDTCNYEAKLAGALNLPMVGFKCTDHSLSDKTLFPTFARTLVPTSKVWKSVIATIKHFEWKKFTPICCNNRKWKMTADKLIELAKSDELLPNELEMYTAPQKPKWGKNSPVGGKDFVWKPQLRNIIKNTKDRTRIYVFLGEKHEMLDFMRALKEMVEPKDYVVITVAMGDSLRRGRFYQEGVEQVMKGTNIKWKNKLRETKDAFRMALVISPRDPGATKDRYEEFIKESKYRSQTVFKVPAVPKYGVLFDETYAVALYDAVYIYVRALHWVLKSKNSSVTDGKAIFNRIVNTTFKGIKGHSVFIDHNGDAEGNFTLLAMKDNGTLRLMPVGSFTQASQASDRLVLELKDSINWLGGVKPRDAPPCGFDNSSCDTKLTDKDLTVATICIISACVILIATVFACRHYLYEQKLASLTWKVDYRDIMISEYPEEPHPTVTSKHKNKVSNQYSFLSYGASEFSEAKPTRQFYTKIGAYKGMVVSIKHLKKKHVEMNRLVKKELQLMLKTNHDNINRFIGACVEPGNICVISVYCQRGSIYDVIRNEKNITLDDMFIKSLVFDLIKGMIYIHESEISEHGNLRSTNCLVDSRWMLQISGFGLHHFKFGSQEMCDAEYYKKQLWRAPELLRDPSMYGRGTQKGDVFSFAVIFHELVTRGAPWGYPDLSPRDIVLRLENRNENPNINTLFRPNTAKIIADDFILRCMEECWSEDPDSRPDFKYIRIKLKPMQQGLKPSIFDNMAALMETYASNLEELVDERTQQLSEEKKKTEALLHKLLPNSVAEQLKRNCPVVPEQYERVTIYFSDIVGFTALSAQSSPMEVVDLLNDLYTLFDSTIGHYDVYKVETIGDAYMVVSGLPIRNGDNHAGEIASMSLNLLKDIKSFKARHRPDDTIQLRIGVHSGKCVAGVVGLKMPRYCLFGDTVNTASRMESTGVALKIHCSQETKAILENLGGYHLEERGLINVKGKGDLLTYFLTGEDATHRLRRISKDDTMVSKIDGLRPDRLINSNSAGSLLIPSTVELDDDLFESPTSSLLVNGGIPNVGFPKAAPNEFLV